MTDAASHLNLLLMATGLLTIFLIAWLVDSSRLMRRSGKLLAFLALFILPVLVTWLGVVSHLAHSRSNDFCLSCHVMAPYGESLYLDSPDYLPATHFQNRRVERDQACYSCHRNYTLFGGLEAKIRGFRHVLVQYAGKTPDTISIHEPYNNRECLHCHEGARSFEESDPHQALREALGSNATSCLDCHALNHHSEEGTAISAWEEGR